MALTKITGQVINDTTGLVVGVTTVGGGLSATDGFFSGIVTAVGNASFSGNLTVGGVLTYEDVTNVDSVGLITARNGIVVGSGITLSKDGDIFATGVCTATSFVGDGTNLTNVGVDTAVVFTDKLQVGDSPELISVGVGSDLQISHSSDSSYIKHVPASTLFVQSGANIVLENSDGTNYVRAVSGGTVELYHSGTKKLETSSAGATLTGTITCDGVTIGDNEVINIGNSSDMKIYHDSGANYVGSYNSQSLVFFTDNTSRWLIQNDGHFRPVADNSYDIGDSSYRVRNIYTADLHCSNKGSSNDVDGTWGDYTIQEGESDLFLINNRNGKKYKFNLTEVS